MLDRKGHNRGWHKKSTNWAPPAPKNPQLPQEAIDQGTQTLDDPTSELETTKPTAIDATSNLTLNPQSQSTHEKKQRKKDKFNEVITIRPSIGDRQPKKVQRRRGECQRSKYMNEPAVRR
jgi:hypothetical protein